MLVTLLALAALACAAGALAAWQMWRGLPPDGLPSLVWSVMIVAPFVAQWGVWQFQATHAAGMLTVGVCLLLADVYATRLAYREAGQQQDDAAAALRVPGVVLAVLGGFSLAMALLHLYLTPNIPLLFLLGHDPSGGADLAMMREESAKLLHVPRVVKFVFNWVVVVFSTIGIVTLLVQRRWRLAAAWYVLALAYAAMTTAKVPAVLLTTSIVGGLVWHFGERLRKRIYLAVAVALVVVAIPAGINLVFNPHSKLTLLWRPDLQQWYDMSEMRSLADLWRIRLDPSAPDAVNVFQNTFGEHLLYRVILTPVEVSNYWYAYYIGQHQQEGGQGLLPWAIGPEFIHPARKVGLWAYNRRFPAGFGKTINAYASADADAFAHFGWPGIIVSAVLLLAFRVSVAWLGRGGGLTRSLSGCAVILFALLVPQASVQAMFVAQGLAFYPAALWLARRL